MRGIGKACRYGLLLLWSTGDRQVRIEVGYGLEGTIPDGKAGADLRRRDPKFKAQNRSGHHRWASREW